MDQIHTAPVVLKKRLCSVEQEFMYAKADLVKDTATGKKIMHECDGFKLWGLGKKMQMPDTWAEAQYRVSCGRLVCLFVAILLEM